MQRFFDKVIIQTNGCWQWTGAARGKSGYACLKVQGKVLSAHRISWELHNGQIPAGLFVCHKCDNRLCVNPDHLFLGTQQDNMQDCSRKGRLHTVRLYGKNNPQTGVIPANGRLSKAEVLQVKEQLKHRKGTLKELAVQLQLPYQLIRDLNTGRVYKN